MAREVLSDVNLLKKYHHNLVVDYTEYPTKGVWKENMDGVDYKKAMLDYIPRSKNPFLFYVHTPFCEELCYFCLCSKEITKDYDRVKDYFYNYQLKEIDMLANFMSENNLKPNIEEVYFGGGSPTYYKEEEFTILMENLRRIIDFDKVKTFTVEIDPRRVDTDRLKFYHKMGANRLSFGVQDFDIGVQKEINRIQPPELLKNLMTPEIRELFPTINFDLLIGLPAQTEDSMRRTIDTVADLGPDQIQTMYVHYKPRTRAYMVKMVRNDPMPDFYERKVLFTEATEGLTNHGYERAGFESFAKSNDILSQAMEDENALYNSLGTTTGSATDFIAVGSSAHGCFGDEYYFQNYYEQSLYREALDKGEFPVYRAYQLNPEDKLRRDVIKRLRTYFSINFSYVEKAHNISSFKEHFAKELETLKEFEKDGIVKISDDHIELTELGKHFSPNVGSVFDEYLDRQHFNPNITTNISQVSAGATV